MDRILGDCFLCSWLIDTILWLIDYVIFLFFQKKKAPILPKELLLEILSRLPSTSVIRFRLVCKEWCLLTSTQTFFEMHQNNQLITESSSSSASVFVVQYFDNERTVPRFQFKTFFINEKATNKNNKFQMVRECIDLTWARDSQQYYHIDLLSSYNGFLLFTAKSSWLDEPESALIFYNPVTKQQVTVTTAPPSRYVYCGFFFHFPTKEYRILYQVFDDDDHKDVTVRFEILGLQTRSLRKIYVNNEKYHPDLSTPAVNSNGALHWMVSEEKVPSCSETILSFGMESEEFRLMPHPRFQGGHHDCVSLQRTPGHKMNLLEMEGGILCLCDAYHRLQLNIYGIENYKNQRWVRILVVPLHAYPNYRPPHDCPPHEYVPHVKALQIHQGELVVYHHPYDSAEEYLLYPLNQEEEEPDDDALDKFIKWISFGNKKLEEDLYKFMKMISFGSKNFEEELECFDDKYLILKNKKKSRFKVVIDRLIFKKNKYLDDDQIVRRIVIEHPGKRPKSEHYSKVPSASVGNIVVLTPSIASLKQRHQTGTTTTTTTVNGNGNGGNYILSLQYENHSTTTLTEYNVQTRK